LSAPSPNGTSRTPRDPGGSTTVVTLAGSIAARPPAENANAVAAELVENTLRCVLSDLFVFTA
jgi:hypothetical protein